MRRQQQQFFTFGRSPDWLKMKNANAPAVKREADTHSVPLERWDEK